MGIGVEIVCVSLVIWLKMVVYWQRTHILNKSTCVGNMPSVQAPKTHRPKVLYFFFVRDPFQPKWCEPVTLSLNYMCAVKVKGLPGNQAAVPPPGEEGHHPWIP